MLIISTPSPPLLSPLEIWNFIVQHLHLTGDFRVENRGGVIPMMEIAIMFLLFIKWTLPLYSAFLWYFKPLSPLGMRRHLFQDVRTLSVQTTAPRVDSGLMVTAAQGHFANAHMVCKHANAFLFLHGYKKRRNSLPARMWGGQPSPVL